MTTPMKSARYEERLNRVVDYIHDHLEEEIDADRLAEVACLSPFHWHRIYTAMRGETVATTVRRLRLARAADRLANSAMPVMEVARRAGYGSVEAFGRAFKDAHGRPPADYRASGSHAAFKAATQASDAAGFPVSIETLPEVRCASVAHSGSYMQIDRAMGRLFEALIGQRLLAGPPRMIGLFFDDPDLVPTEKLRSVACVPVGREAKPAAPLDETTLRGGLYARLRYKGPYADMKNAYRWLWGVWLPQSGYDPAEALVYEEYLNDPRNVPPSDLLTDIHLPLQEAS